VLTLTTIATNNWSITIGGGWIVLMLIGMGLWFVFMLSSTWLMRNGRGWSMCGFRWPEDTTRSDILTYPTLRSPDQKEESSERRAQP
jgi:hypothetical protein